MHSLAELQADFARRILHPEAGIPPSLARPKQTANNHQRFGVYRNNVIASLIEAMGDNFPVTKRLVGDDFFSAIARIWVISTPPKYPMIFRYGEGFAGFLDAFEPVQTLPYLGDIARLEQARREAHYAPDTAVLSISKLQDIAEDDLSGLILHLHPGAAIIQSTYPIQTMWEYNSGEKSQKELDLQGILGENVFIVRPHLDVHHHCVSTAEATFISALLQGMPFGEAANLATALPGFKLAPALGFLFHSGGVSELKLARQ